MILREIITTHILELLLITISVYVAAKTYSEHNSSKVTKAFSAFAIANAIFQFLDLCMSLNRSSVCFNGHVTGSIIYVLTLTVMAGTGYHWFMYVEAATDSKVFNTKKNVILWSIPLIIFSVMCVASVKTGWIFTFDTDGKYQIGSLFILQYVVIFGYCLLAMGRSAANYFIKKDKRETDRTLLIIMLVDTVAVIIQLSYMVNMMNTALVLTVLLSYLTVYTAEVDQIRISLEKELVLHKDREIEHKILSENNARMLALEDNIVSLYDLDLDTGEYEMYVKNDANDHEIISQVVKGSSFYEDTIKNSQTVVYPEDRDSMIEILSSDYIRGALEKESHFDYYYRLLAGDTPVWAKLRIVYKDDEKRRVIIGAFNAEEEMAAKQKQDELQKELLNSMAGDEGVFLIDCANDTRKTIHDRVHSSSEFADINGYSDNFRRYVDTYVAEPDREIMHEFSSPEYILDCLKSEKEHTVRYREIYTAEPRWFEMHTVKLSDTSVLQSFKDINDQVIKEQATEAIFRDAFGIYVVDLRNDLVRVVKRVTTFLGDSKRTVNTYSKIIPLFVSILSDNAKKPWKGLDTIEGIKEFLKDQDKREFVFDSPAREGQLVRVTWYVIERTAGEANTVCFAFTDLDKEEADREKLNEQIAEQKEQLQEANLRNEMLYEVSNAIKWSYEISADDEIVSYSYTDQADELVQSNNFEGNPMAWADVVHPDDRDEAINAFESAIHDHSDETPYDSTYRIMGVDGEYVWLKVAGRMHRREDGSGEMVGVSIDITEQMEEQQKRLLGAVRISSDILAKENIGMWAFELDEGQPPRMYGDDAMLRLVGLDHQVPPEEMYHAWYDQIDEDSYGLVNDAVEKMMAGEHAEVQYPWHHPNGHTMIVRCGGVRNPEYTEGIRVEGTHQNVTEVLHFDDEERRALEENNARLFALEDSFESLYDVEIESGNYVSFAKGEFYQDTVIDKLVEPTDYFEDLRDNIDAVIYEEDRDDLYNTLTREAIRRNLAGNDHFDYYYRIKTENEPMWFKMRIVYKDEEKKNIIIGVFNAEKDVEAQQLQDAFNTANEANLRNEALFTMTNASQWSYEIDASGKVVSARYGERIRTHTNADKGDPMGWINIIHPEDRERVIAEFTASVSDRSGKTPYDTTYRTLMKDGSIHWAKVNGRLISHVDGTAELFGMSIDITEQIEQEREQQRQLAEALSMAESANRAKTTFLNNMSHDIRTPMNAIIGFTGLAASHIDNKEQVQNYLTKIGQSSNHLLSLINDVLDMSRIESGKMNLDEKPENLPDIIHTLRDIVQSEIHAKQHDFFIDTVNVKDENIIVDKLRLNQVLLNILSNAIKYTAQGGIVSMRITELTVKPSGYATYEFRIKDNGMGMNDEFIDTLFDPFTRAKSSTVSGIQGTGLGMAVTKNIVDMMGGKIEVNSEPSKGTEMVVTFDFKLTDAPKKIVPIQELSGLRGLVVDDDANACVSIYRMLGEIGMRAEWCTTGKEAVFRAQTAYQDGNLFKVYIIDWLMPDMNGIETTRRIRKVIGDDVPIIILTAYDWAEIEDEAREAGVTAFVSKPMFPSDLQRVLNNCLGKKEEPAKNEDNEYDFAGRKVLLVEDNELNREIATEILEEEGFIIDTAEDGDIAVEKMSAAGTGDYDLVLMDIQMPRMNGYEATRQIRALGTDVSKIPILAMTANAFEEDKKLALEAGMNEHISKPIDISLLKETLAKFL